MTCECIRDQGFAERYLRGQLAGGDHDDYELHYFSCDTCYSELEAMRLLGSELAAHPVPVTSWSRPKPKWLWWAVPSLAACAMLIVGITFLRQPDPVPLPVAKVVQSAPEVAGDLADAKLVALAKFDAPAYREAILRGTAPAGNSFAQAMRLYQARDYRAAAARLEPLLKLEPRSTPIVFYAAVCRMLNNDAAGAERGATQSLQLGEHLYVEESYWLRAKARFALGNVSAAKDDLRRLALLKGDWEKRARGLLSQSELLSKSEEVR